MKLKFKQS